jgi:hypothetical protein
MKPSKRGNKPYRFCDEMVGLLFAFLGWFGFLGSVVLLCCSCVKSRSPIQKESLTMP